MGLIFEVAEGGALDIDVNIEGKDQAFDMDRAVSQGKTEYSSTEHLL